MITVITTHYKRLRQAKPLPDVECTEVMAREFFRGWWGGIATGLVCGFGAAVILLQAVR